MIRTHTMARDSNAVLFEQLSRASVKARAFLQSQIGADGRLRGGCEGRPLETTLTIHLFRNFPSIRNQALDQHSDALLAYCERFYSSAAFRSTGTILDIDTTLSRTLVSKIIDDHAPESLIARGIPRSFNTFTHPSTARKRILFSILLAEMGIISFHALEFDWDQFSSKEYHLFASLIMTAAKILYAVGREQRSAIGNSDVNFLVENQSPNGGWENHVLLTLATLMALTKLGTHSDAVARGVDFVVRQIRVDSSVPFITDEDTWVTCMAGFVLAKADRSHPHLGRVAEYIASQQLPSGGFAYSEGVKTDDADDLSISLTFLKQYDAARFQDAIRRGEARLLSLQNEDGGFPAFIRGASSEVEITAKAIVTLTSDPRTHEDRVEHALAWLASAQDVTGAFRREWKISSSYPIAHVMYALNRARLDHPSSLGIRRKAAAYILDIQEEDGGWSPLPGALPSSVLSTAYALIALCNASDPVDPAVLTKASEYILQHQEETGQFPSAPDSVSPRPIICDVKPLSTIYSLWAVSEMIDFMSGARSP
jgi:squalene-hopene/tetraprenyl-beta-curcumene cyclase